MSIKSNWFCLGVLVFSLFSCDKANTDETSGQCESSIPFLRTGNEMVYDFVQFGSNVGTMKMSFGECNGNGYLVTRNIYNSSGVLSSSTVDLMKQEGDYLLIDSKNDKDYFSKNYKKNAKLNEEWQYTRSDKSVVTHKVVDLDSLITVPAGVFHCKVFKYTTTTAINESYVFWNDDFGNIYEDNGLFKMKLKSHK